MDARQLRYFLAVVDHGTVHRAAAELFVAQPSISQALRALERDLGTLLFHRAGRKLVLSPAGEALIDPARQVMRWLDLARASVDAAEGLEAGQLVVAAMPSQSVDPLTTLIAGFSARHPRVRISVRTAATPADVTASLRTGDAELGLVAARERAGHGDLVSHPLETQRFIVVAPPDDALPAHTPLRFADLAGRRLVVGQPGTGMRRVADAVVAAAPGSYAAVETEHRAAILPLVLAGVGVAVLSESWRQLAATAGALVRDLDCDEALHVALVHRSGPVSPAAAAFLAVANALR
ncbi:LysR family transcriptional regulator [Prauserella flavalba]|uniref:LysR family transcriptional regulator n=1 Tax=Prauserella flavalba TaxID=1477506 RepID=A0A318LRG8_9PSEU|nr:LysR family transcriptional regulator [Prauserella flavalba]PXY36200.1 LysR family transcriptional regulator [Prauserella flavalba]